MVDFGNNQFTIFACVLKQSPAPSMGPGRTSFLTQADGRGEVAAFLYHTLNGPQTPQASALCSVSMVGAI